MPRPTNDPPTRERADATLDASPNHDARPDAPSLPRDAQPDGSSLRRNVRDEASSRRERLFARPRWSWNIIAVVCLVAATIALVNSYIDAAFVTATLGVVAWFLEVRNKYKVARIESDDAESEFAEDRDEH